MKTETRKRDLCWNVTAHKHQTCFNTNLPLVAGFGREITSAFEELIVLGHSFLRDLGRIVVGSDFYL